MRARRGSGLQTREHSYFGVRPLYASGPGCAGLGVVTDPSPEAIGIDRLKKPQDSGLRRLQGRDGQVLRHPTAVTLPTPLIAQTVVRRPQQRSNLRRRPTALHLVHRIWEGNSMPANLKGMAGRGGGEDQAKHVSLDAVLVRIATARYRATRRAQNPSSA